MTGLFVRSPDSRHKGVLSPQSVKSRDANGDEAIASELLLRLHREERERNCAFKYLEARARNLANHHWRMIEALAKALLERQSLTGKEVRAVLAASFQAQMQEDRLRRQTP